MNISILRATLAIILFTAVGHVYSVPVPAPADQDSSEPVSPSESKFTIQSTPSSPGWDVLFPGIPLVWDPIHRTYSNTNENQDSGRRASRSRNPDKSHKRKASKSLLPDGPEKALKVKAKAKSRKPRTAHTVGPKPDEFPCPFPPCKQGVALDLILAHMRASHVDELKTFDCKRCPWKGTTRPVRFDTMAEVAQHWEAVHGIAYQGYWFPRSRVCVQCEEKFSSVALLETHSGNAHDKVDLRCNLITCTWSGETAQSLTMHFRDEKTHHRRKGLWYPIYCPLRLVNETCRTDFDTIPDLDKHVVNSHGEDPFLFECMGCPFRTNTLASLVQHQVQAKHYLLT